MTSRLTAPERGLEQAVARLLTVGTYLSVAFLAVGFVAMLAAGISPLEASQPRLDLGRIPGDLGAGRPAGYLWVGLVVVVAMPASRVVAALIGYVRRRDWRMVCISVGILTVIALSVAVAGGTAA